MLTSIRVCVSLAFSEFSASVTDSEALEDFVVSAVFAVSLDLEGTVFPEGFAEVLSKADPPLGVLEAAL